MYSNRNLFEMNGGATTANMTNTKESRTTPHKEQVVTLWPEPTFSPSPPHILHSVVLGGGSLLWIGYGVQSIWE